GAPYWDLSFPAKLKIYLERCSVDKLTFIYDENGVPHGQCRANALTYITTAGGYIGDMNFGFDYVKSLCSVLFGIKNFYFAGADGIDIVGVNVDARMEEAKRKFTDIIKEI
ncbi:MAG: NAD(P)H-dependent oxidoreductase, partial [Firmicutes bacterium]|nr:NAD(P)H-dependent oxidoreductase [Bacillota bacterium]